jgi:hypothetical protein
MAPCRYVLANTRAGGHVCNRSREIAVISFATGSIAPIRSAISFSTCSHDRRRRCFAIAVLPGLSLTGFPASYRVGRSGSYRVSVAPANGYRRNYKAVLIRLL